MSSTTTTTSTSSELAKALSKFDTKTTTEILLDGKVRGLIFSDENNKLFMEYKLLRKLSLVGNNIKSIDNFPSIPTLKTLQLDDNNISSGFDSLQGLTGLKTLSLAGNPIKTTDDLQPLFLVDGLQSLNLDSCPVQEEDYEDGIFQMLPQLVILDSHDKDGESVDEEESEDDEEEDDDVNDTGANLMGDDNYDDAEEDAVQEGEDDDDDGLGFASSFNNDEEDDSNNNNSRGKLGRQNSLADASDSMANLDDDDEVVEVDKDGNQVLGDGGLTDDDEYDDDDGNDGLSMLVSGNVESDDDGDEDFIDDGEDVDDDDFIDESDEDEDGNDNPRKKQKTS